MLKNVLEFTSVSYPNGPSSGASVLEWTGKGVRVCAQKSVSLFQILDKVSYVFYENHSKTTFFFPPSYLYVFPGPQSLGTSTTLKEPHQRLFLSFTIPTPRDTLPTSSFPDPCKETWKDTHARARACTHPNKHAHPGHRDCAPLTSG